MDLKERVERSKAICFDLFHTLFSFKSEGIQGRDTSMMLGISETTWNRALFELSDERLRGLDTNKYSIIRSLAERCGLQLSEEALVEIADYREERFRLGFLNTSVSRLNVLRRLRGAGKRLGLISNADAVEVAGWDESGLAQVFDCAVFSFQVGFVKPEPEIYQRALLRLGVVAEETIFVGDGSSRELKGARELGMTTVMTTEIIKDKWPERIGDLSADADYMVSDLSELVEGIA